MLEWLRQYRAARFGVGILVLFLVACVQSCSELRHALWGANASAKIIRVEPSSYGPRDEFLTLTFDDADGKNHVIKRTVGSKLGPFKASQTVAMIYIPGEPEKARLSSERSMFWPTVLLVMTAASVLWLLYAIREVKAGRGI
jgi:hypothetical protein